GQRDGAWKVHVSRPSGRGEFPSAKPALRYFVTTLVDGGPVMQPFRMPPLYTGDVLNPKVILREPSGHHFDATVTVDIESPTEGTGNILTKQGLGAPGYVGGDQVDARANRLIALEQAKGSELIGAAKRTVSLFDDGGHDDEAIESDGVFGNPIADLTRFEGHYRFHSRGVYGEQCTAAREASWSVYVSVGIDPGSTTVATQPAGTAPDGRDRTRVTFTPRDKFGNYLGPGRFDSFTVGDAPGCQLDGGLKDNGDGSYTQDVLCDPDSDSPPGVVVTQPGRPPVVVTEPPRDLFSYSVKFLCGRQDDCKCECAPVRPGVYATEINIHNYHDETVAVRKFVIPIVLAGAPIGREPGVAKLKAVDRIILPPHTATMDDCCRLGELLFGAAQSGATPLTIGILEIISPQELNVTAVYSVAGLASGAVDMDVEQVRGTRLKR
ncbi:MAG: hypothetical protein ACRD8O_05240, partial [Bryobacteraceae bacterium]